MSELIVNSVSFFSNNDLFLFLTYFTAFASADKTVRCSFVCVSMKPWRFWCKGSNCCLRDYLPNCAGLLFLAKTRKKSLRSAFLDKWVVHRNNNGVLYILFSVMLWTPRSFVKSSKPSAYTNSHEACMKRMHEHATAWIQIYCAFWCGAKCPHRNTPRSLNFFWRQFSEGIGTCRRKSLAGKALTLCLDASVSYSDHLIAMAEIRDNSGQRDGAGLWRNERDPAMEPLRHSREANICEVDVSCWWRWVRVRDSLSTPEKQIMLVEWRYRADGGEWGLGTSSALPRSTSWMWNGVTALMIVSECSGLLQDSRGAHHECGMVLPC